MRLCYTVETRALRLEIIPLSPSLLALADDET